MTAPEVTIDLRVGKGYEVVLPPELRERLAIHEGDVLHATVVGAALMLEVAPSDPLERLRWAFAGAFEGIDGMDYQRSIRADWDDDSDS